MSSGLSPGSLAHRRRGEERGRRRRLHLHLRKAENRRRRQNGQPELPVMREQEGTLRCRSENLSRKPCRTDAARHVISSEMILRFVSQVSRSR
jgi:hypothetical protein